MVEDLLDLVIRLVVVVVVAAVFVGGLLSLGYESRRYNTSIDDFRATPDAKGGPALLEWEISSGHDVACVLRWGDSKQAEIRKCVTNDKKFHAYEKPGGYIAKLTAYNVGDGFNFQSLPEPEAVETVALRVHAPTTSKSGSRVHFPGDKRWPHPAGEGTAPRKLFEGSLPRRLH